MLNELIPWSDTTQVSVASGDSLDVRRFQVTEGVSTLFRIDLTVRSPNQDIDFRLIVGAPASVEVRRNGQTRLWQGVVDDIVQTRVEPNALASYELSVVPTLWLATQGQNYRIFQNQSELDVVETLLAERGIVFENRTRHRYGRRSFIIQYGESDFAFLSRMLEAIGVAYAFMPGETENDKDLKLVLSDWFEAAEPSVESLPYLDSPTAITQRWASELSVRHRVRPGKHRVQDLDYRRPSNAQPALEVRDGLPQEQALEVMEWNPGAFLFETDIPENTPVADDRGIPRTDTTRGHRLVENRLLASRASARVIAFATPAIDLVPGRCLMITGHPSREVLGRRLLVVRSLMEGGPETPLHTRVECAATDQPYRPAMVTPKPRIQGVESAVVVGPPGEEIHTDELGRVRIHFHWDRRGGRNEQSSCWVVVNQPWGGAGFGAINLPRVGQEVLVEFIGGDPDKPVIIGRVFTTTQPPPYKLPDFKKVSGIRSATSGEVESALAGAALGLAVNLLGGKGKPLAASEICDALTHPFFKAQSPDTATHQWSGNEVSFFDQPDAQQLYMQAEKDMNVVVKNAKTAIIGNSRSEQVGTDDILSVGNRQSIVVADNQSTLVFGDRSIHVMGAETHTTEGNHSVTTHANLTVTTTLTSKSEAKIQEHSAEDLIVFKVGASRIVMRPDFIIIQSTDVFINPGDADTDAAIADGTRPIPESEKQAAAAEAAEAAAEAQTRRAQAANERDNALLIAERNNPSREGNMKHVINDMIIDGRDIDPDYQALSLDEKIETLSWIYGGYGLDGDAAAWREIAEMPTPFKVP